MLQWRWSSYNRTGSRPTQILLASGSSSCDDIIGGDYFSVENCGSQFAERTKIRSSKLGLALLWSPRSPIKVKNAEISAKDCRFL